MKMNYVYRLLLRYQTNMIIIVTQFGKTTLVAHNDFKQMLTFKHSLYGHFAIIFGILEEQLLVLLDTKFSWLRI